MNLTIESLREVLESFGPPMAWERTIVCHPDDEQAVQTALDMVPEALGRVRLLVREHCPKGKVLNINDEAVEAPITGAWR